MASECNKLQYEGIEIELLEAKVCCWKQWGKIWSAKETWP